MGKYNAIIIFSVNDQRSYIVIWYFGNWLSKSIELPLIPMFTEEQWEEAKKEAEEIRKK